MAMTQRQRLRAQRLRRKLARGLTPLTATETRWLEWYEGAVNVAASIAATPEPPEDEPADAAPEPEAPEPEDEPEDEPEPPREPEPEPPRYESPRTERADLPHVVSKLHREDCTDEALRSAVNVQIAAGQMMERACVIAMDLAQRMADERAGLVGQLVDTIAALADAQSQRVAAQTQQTQQTQAGAAEAGAVTDEIAKRMIDNVFPAAAKTEPPATT